MSNPELFMSSIPDFVAFTQTIHNIMIRLSYSKYDSQVALAPNRIAFFLRSEVNKDLLIVSIEKQGDRTTGYFTDWNEHDMDHIKTNLVRDGQFDQDTMHPIDKTLTITSEDGLREFLEEVASLDPNSEKDNAGLVILHHAAVQTLCYLDDCPDLSVDTLKTIEHRPSESSESDTLKTETSDKDTFAKTTIDVTYTKSYLTTTFFFRGPFRARTVIGEKVRLADLVDAKTYKSLSKTEKQNTLRALSCLARQNDEVTQKLNKAKFFIEGGISFNEPNPWF